MKLYTVTLVRMQDYASPKLTLAFASTDERAEAVDYAKSQGWSRQSQGELEPMTVDAAKTTLDSAKDAS